MVFQSILCLFPVTARAVQVGTSKISFCPNGETVSAQLVNRSKSSTMLKEIVEMRGGSDRDYGYSGSGGRGRYGDSSGRSSGGYHYDDDRYGGGGGGGYGDDRYGAQQDYNDDRYGERQQGDGYEDDYYYGESQSYRERDYTPNKKASKSSPLSNIPDVGGILRNGNKKIGLALLGAGTVFTLLGISLFFNKTLMRLGNLFFIAGVPMTIGPGRTTGYFLQPKKSRATGCLAFGIFLVFVGWPIIGIALEIFGILNLFGNMFPVLMVVLKQMPFVGNILNGSGKQKPAKKNSHKAESRDRYSYDDEDYYENNRGQEDGYNDRGQYY